MSAHTPFAWTAEDRLDSGGSGAPGGEAWIWVKAGYATGDPEAPDTRVGSADPLVATEIVRRWNAHPDLLAALERQAAHLETGIRLMNEQPECPDCGANVEHSTDCSIHAQEFLHADASAAIAKARGGK